MVTNNFASGDPINENINKDDINTISHTNTSTKYQRKILAVAC